MRGPTVRRATSADSEAISSLSAASGVRPEDVERALASLEAQGACVVVAQADDGGLAGVGVLEVTPGGDGAPPVGLVTLLAVHDSWRGRGVGATLLEALRLEAAARGCREVRVTTPRRAGRP